MSSENLQQIVDRAMAHARDHNHNDIALDHLLLALTEDKDAVAALKACGVDIELFRRGLSAEVKNLRNLVTNDARVGPRPSTSFVRALQFTDYRAPNDTPTGANMLAALFEADPLSRAVQFLGKHGIKKASDVFSAITRVSQSHRPTTVVRGRTASRRAELAAGA